MKQRRVELAALIAFALLAACGGGGGTSATKPPPSPTPLPSPSPSPSPQPLTLDTVITALKTLGVPIGVATVYTAESDPEHLLGKPNQYLARAAWQDTRVAPTATSADVSTGGAIEAFASAGDLAARLTELGAGRAATEKDYASANKATLFRFSGAMPAEVVGQYVGIAKTVYPDIAPV